MWSMGLVVEKESVVYINLDVVEIILIRWSFFGFLRIVWCEVFMFVLRFLNRKCNFEMFVGFGGNERIRVFKVSYFFFVEFYC